MLRRRPRAASLLAIGATLAALALVNTPTGAGATPPPNTTERVSADGNVVLFHSTATDLVNGPGAVYHAKNLTTGVSPVPVLADMLTRPRLTGDGSSIVFDSRRADLVPGDTNGKPDVFVYDLAASTTTRVSVDSNGAQYPAGDSLQAGISDNAVISGGSGSDTASFAGSAALIDADLALGTAIGQGSDTLIGIENLEGSAYADKLKGDAGPNRFTGLGGADAISGFGGDDWMDCGAANDKLDAHAGRDTLLSGGADVDSLDGGDATDAPVTACEG